MPNHFIRFNEFIKSKVDISDHELNEFSKKCEIVEFPKGTVIIKRVNNKRHCFLLIKDLLEII
jgi:hypothetical protein